MRCYTIGHSTRNLDNFVNILEKYRIQYILDLREDTFSTNKYTEKFNQDSLEESLSNSKIKYLYIGKKLRDILRKNALLKNNSILEFESAIECDTLNKLVCKIIARIKNGDRIAIMCQERNPLNCCRSILLGYILFKHGVCIEHIIDENKSKNQSRIEEEIFLTYEPKLKDRLVEFSMQDVLNSDTYDNICIKDSKRRIIEWGYRLKWKEINLRKGLKV